MSASDEARFWSKVEGRGGPDCWVWTGSRPSGRYGQLWISGRPVYAHRFSWEAHYGSVPHGLHVLHRCDNPPCVNPEHLFLGTQRTNMRDAAEKGRLSGPRRRPTRRCLECDRPGHTQRTCPEAAS